MCGELSLSRAKCSLSLEFTHVRPCPAFLQAAPRSACKLPSTPSPLQTASCPPLFLQVAISFTLARCPLLPPQCPHCWLLSAHRCRPPQPQERLYGCRLKRVAGGGAKAERKRWAEGERHPALSSCGRALGTSQPCQSLGREKCPTLCVVSCTQVQASVCPACQCRCSPQPRASHSPGVFLKDQ